MSIKQLLLALPNHPEKPTGRELTVHQWSTILEQFGAQGGHEVILGGAEPLGYPGFWALVRRAKQVRIPQVTAYVSGSLLEPWVVREIVQTGIQLLVSLDSLIPANHDFVNGAGSHSKALAALDSFLGKGLAARVGIIAVANRLTQHELPLLGAWAAQRGVSRMLWTTVPDGGWPSPQLKMLRLSPEEKLALATNMQAGASTNLCQSLDLLRVGGEGEAAFGFSGEDGLLGNLKRALLKELLARTTQAAGD